MRTDTIRNLFKLFPELGKIPEKSVNLLQEQENKLAEKDELSIGAEVEVRFSQYFPEIWNHYGLANWSYLDLPVKYQEALTQETSKEEHMLLDKLTKTIQAGIPRGKDRYWEFALEPCFNPAILAYEIQLLKKLNLIPIFNTNETYSLQVTIGGITSGVDTGLVLMLLELFFVSPKRILEAVNPDKALSWGRRSRAGIRERLGTTSVPLGLGKETAVEFRTLELSTSEYQTANFFFQVVILARCSLKKTKIEQDIWNLFVSELELIAFKFGLPDIRSNWGHSYENCEAWKKLAIAMKLADKNELYSLLKKLIETSPYMDNIK